MNLKAIIIVVFFCYLLCATIHIKGDEEGYRVLQYYTGQFNEKIYYEGLRLHNDRLIHNVSIVAESHDLPTIVRKIKYPQHFSKGYKISHIQVIDRAECEGQVFIGEGGVGHRNVTFRLEAHQFKGMNYNVLIYSLEPVYYMDGVTVLHSHIENMIKKARQNRDNRYLNEPPFSS